MQTIDWNGRVKEALDRTEFMAISTVGQDGSWTCPVQFGYSEKLDLYFKSMPSSKHAQNILKDNRTSAAIFKTERFPGPDRDVLGLQLKGTAELLTTNQNVEEAARCYYGRDPRKLDYRTKVKEHLGESAEWNFFKIVPVELWCFDSREFGEEREKVELGTLMLSLHPK
jgi:general stress protein 26